ncbi:unnamed protein product, partial [Mycena citricolor]
MWSSSGAWRRRISRSLFLDVWTASVRKDRRGNRLRMRSSVLFNILKAIGIERGATMAARQDYHGIVPFLSK